MVDRFRGTSIGLKLLCALLAFGFIVRLVVVLLSVNSEGAVDVAAFDSYVGFSTKSESFTWFWTWLTYSFFHAQVSHFIWNYLLLLLLIFWSKERYAGFNALKYWIAGAACGLAFLLCIEKEVSLIGASSGITALWVGWLFFEFGKNGERGLSFWLGCVVFLFLEIIDIVNYEVQNLSLFAHIGGALGGLLMAVSEKYNRVEMNWIQKIFSWLKPSPNLTVKRSNKRFQTDEEFNAERKLREDYLNSILDKISRSGFESLSAKEKQFLDLHKEK
jgi:membrane associated rhomboid family serine protease